MLSHAGSGPASLTKGSRPLIGDVISVDGRGVHYHSLGHGLPVVLLHGNGSLGEEILRAFPEVPGLRWIAPDRPGYGYSAPLRDGRNDPQGLARWLGRFIEALSVGRCGLVAHSLAAGAALCLAQRSPRRLTGLVLLAPFCRPTPERWMPALRLAAAPRFGALVRPLIPRILPFFRHSILQTMMAPNGVPPWMEYFPLEHAVQPESVLTAGAELVQFNDTMEAAQDRLCIRIPTTAVVGMGDRTADPEWHLPWLEARVEHLRIIRCPGAGHAIHHAMPQAVREAVVSAFAAPAPRSSLRRA